MEKNPHLGGGGGSPDFSKKKYPPTLFRIFQNEKYVISDNNDRSFFLIFQMPLKNNEIKIKNTFV
jgi:hypothetical protein